MLLVKKRVFASMLLLVILTSMLFCLLLGLIFMSEILLVLASLPEVKIVGVTFCFIFTVDISFTILSDCVVTAILYHLYNLKNVKNTHGEVLLLLKVALLHRCFSRF